MNSKSILLAVAAALIMVVSGCRSNQQAYSTTALTGAETYCLSNPGDGTVTLMAWGTGANRAEAIDNAIRQAVNQVLFKTTKTGPGAVGSAIYPLVTEVNARERYAYYFEPFFRPGGMYLTFASESTANKGSRTEAKSAGRQGDGIVVVVDRSALRQRLIDDGILKP